MSSNSNNEPKVISTETFRLFAESLAGGNFYDENYVAALALSLEFHALAKQWPETQAPQDPRTTGSKGEDLSKFRPLLYSNWPNPSRRSIDNRHSGRFGSSPM
jgi:hypothetical protein